MTSHRGTPDKRREGPCRHASKYILPSSNRRGGEAQSLWRQEEKLCYSLTYHAAPRGDVVGRGARRGGHDQPVSLRRGHQLSVHKNLQFQQERTREGGGGACGSTNLL